ncbi:sensor histidine kinase [Halodesulfovibrio marinisediminis]|uniref:histidine kinase n=1 Tax=Halodesulfovibrio marinisediminis DSM 17456 TaxID=1121457 RepID=A0A1N6DX67_9BACT|nr:HAMP domain-containing sensor histidine kinase [Halodesulfovibrio marinisediminis]SIN75317.1 His Kinase A (phospho-acceptor) domain-containing protein [Halodesulfovibrio marinisediminis DSM 17456]
MKLNIKQRILVGFLLLSIGLGSQTVFFYNQLLTVEDKISSVEFIDDIAKIILEFRRQEKNYLLYGEQESYQTALKGIDNTLELLHRRTELQLEPEIIRYIIQLKDTISLYKNNIIAMHGVKNKDSNEYKKDVEKLRNTGHELVVKAQLISRLERENILHINRLLRNYILISVLAVAGLLFFTVYFLSKGIIAPLKAIEETTQKIAQGNFSNVNVKKYDDEMSQVQKAFNSMVAELENRQTQLVQAQKLSSIGTLSAGIAHQVNNPLNNISTSAQILQEVLSDSADSFQKKLLHNIESETLRARDIVKGLLEFARHTDLCMQVVTLSEVVGKAVSLVSSQVPSGVSLTVDVPSGITVYIDPQRMGEVLINLIINAIQAIEPERGEIHIYVSEKATHDMSTIVVADTGKGISEEDLPKVFDPFFTQKEVGQGTGLGLSVAYGIIEEFNGKIRVESELGKGTCFFIDLPKMQHSSSAA